MDASQIFELPGAEIRSLTKTAQGFQIEATTLVTGGTCPDCTTVSTQIHSRYQRHPRDLPCQGVKVTLHLAVKRFFCRNPRCSRRTFVEAIPPLVLRYARRTLRLTDHLQAIAFALGGESGTRLSTCLGISTSPATALRIIEQTALPEPPTPRVLGGDDWAYRKGQRYGTVLCDLERHCVIELLPDREAKTLAKWLKAHPGVEIISRDRGSAYIEGATLGAPHAQQVADRWHLLKNLREVVQTILEQQRRVLRINEEGPVPASLSGEQLPSTPSAGKGLSKKAQASALRREKRLARYQHVMELHAKGVATQAISQLVGSGEETVKRYVEAAGFPEIKRSHTVVSKTLAPYLDYLNQRWTEGCYNATQLWREITAQGYPRSLQSVQNYLAPRRHAVDLSPPLPLASQPIRVRRYTPRQVAWFVMADKKELDPQVQHDLALLRQRSAAIDQAYQLAKSFITLVRERQADQLATSLKQAWAASAVWQTFATGLYKDHAAVRAALSLEWSNGQTEGQVNRLKTIKRQMYGRAGFALLRKRILYRAA